MNKNERTRSTFCHTGCTSASFHVLHQYVFESAWLANPFPGNPYYKGYICVVSLDNEYERDVLAERWLFFDKKNITFQSSVE